MKIIKKQHIRRVEQKTLPLLSLITIADQVPAGLWMAVPSGDGICPITGSGRDHLEILISGPSAEVESATAVIAGGGTIRLFNVRSYVKCQIGE